MELNVIKLEDDMEYAIINIVKYNGYDYVYLFQVDDEETFTIRKVITEDNEKCLVKLDTEEEFNNVLSLFTESLRGKNE